MLTDRLSRQKVFNQGFLFNSAPILFQDVHQSRALITSLGKHHALKGLDDRLRKKIERLGSDPTAEKVERVFQDTIKLIGIDIPQSALDSCMQEALIIFPDDVAHAGAWVIVYSFAKGVCDSTTDAETTQFAKFLMALAEVDRELLVTRSDEDASYLGRLLFPWMSVSSPNQANQFHISTLLLWASLTRLFNCILLKEESALLAPENLLMNSLPAVGKKKGELILSSDAAIQHLKKILPQLAEGTEPKFTNLALAMNIDETTLRRIRKGDALLKRDQLLTLLQQPEPFPATPSNTFINIWTRRQKDMYEAGMDPLELVECFSHYKESLKRTAALFDGFKASGLICLPS